MASKVFQLYIAVADICLSLVNGNKCVAKELVEAIDGENKYIKFKIIEGDLLKEFKSLTVSLQVVPKGEITAVK